MNNIKSKFSLFLLSASVLGSAFAAPHESGAYLEGNVGTLYASLQFMGMSYSALGSLGVNANAGYQINRYLATEMGYTNYGGGNNSLNNIDLALKGILPFSIGNNDFSLFAKAGPAYVFTGGDHQIVPFAGVGASYALTSNMDMNVQAQGISNGFFSLGLLSAGLTYHFG